MHTVGSSYYTVTNIQNFEKLVPPLNSVLQFQIMFLFFECLKLEMTYIFRSIITNYDRQALNVKIFKYKFRAYFYVYPNILLPAMMAKFICTTLTNRINDRSIFKLPEATFIRQNFDQPVCRCGKLKVWNSQWSVGFLFIMNDFFKIILDGNCFFGAEISCKENDIIFMDLIYQNHWDIVIYLLI